MRNIKKIPDCKIKQKFYEKIANFLSEKTDIDFDICLYATYLLCQEDETCPSTFGKNESQVLSLVEQAKNHILAIKLQFHYKMKDAYVTETQIFYVEEEKVRLTKITEELFFDQLPSELQDFFLTTDQSSAIIKLFP